MAKDKEDLQEDGEDIADSADAADTGGKFNAKKLVLFVVLPLFILVGAGAGLYFTGSLDKFLKKDEAAGEEHAAADDGHGKPAKDSHGNIV
ncbi:MAG: flagellar basal body protein FliL, partial [Micavibrio aeruginosavorus]|nr:flagellar basal body protein FliL [Micavibrio aeruginosavorus]